MADKPAGTTLDALAKQFGITPEELAKIQAGSATTADDPFSSDTSNVPLFLGRQPKAAEALAPIAGSQLPGTRPAKIKRYGVEFHGQTIYVTAPDMGSGVTMEVHTVAVGGKAHSGKISNDQLRKADLNGLRIEVQFKKKGQIVFRQSLNNEQAAIATGRKMGEHGKIVEVNSDPWAGAEDRAATAGDEPITGTLTEELKKIYKYSPEELTQLKTKLWLAGYYGKGVTLDQVNMKVIGQDDVAALSEVMLQASRYWKAGQEVTWQELLEKQAMDPSSQLGAKNPISLTDTAKITKDANDMASKMLGHKASNQDVQTLIQLIHGKETQHDTAMSAGGTAESPDLEAQMDQYFRQTYPNETLATDWHDNAKVWQDMLTTPPVSSPGVTEL